MKKSGEDKGKSRGKGELKKEKKEGKKAERRFKGLRSYRGRSNRNYLCNAV